MCDIGSSIHCRDVVAEWVAFTFRQMASILVAGIAIT
jgi:hypothetical protein